MINTAAHGINKYRRVLRSKRLPRRSAKNNTQTKVEASYELATCVTQSSCIIHASS